MKGITVVGISLLTTILMAAAWPASALPLAASDDDPWVAWFSSSGTSGTSRLSDLRSDVGDATEQHCYGTAPFDTGCTLSASGVTNWVVGWTAPAHPDVPAGVLLARETFEMTGSNGGYTWGRCDMHQVGFGQQQLAGGFACQGWPRDNEPRDDVTVVFTVEEWHFWVTDTPVPNAMVGTWHAIFFTG